MAGFDIEAHEAERKFLNDSGTEAEYKELNGALNMEESGVGSTAILWLISNNYL